jgi:hypothetical protein
MPNPDEHARVVELLERYDLLPYRDRILEQAQPCIAMNLEAPPVERPSHWPLPPMGASKVGGLPDLPANFPWPVRGGCRAGFFLQIALADLPVVDWNPWPARGMVYVFCHDDTAAFFDPPSWELLYFDGPGAALERGVAPAEPLQVESYFFEASDPRRIVFSPGTDFTPGSQRDWSWFVNPLQHAGEARKDPDVLDRYFEFATIAADPDVEANRRKGHGPFYFPVGRLFGHTDRSLRQDLTLVATGNQKHSDDWGYRRAHAAELDRLGSAWRQIMRLESNPATDHTSPYDAAPVYVMAKDPGTRPWMPSGLVYGLAAK